METADKGEYHDDERKPVTTQQCPRKEDGNWYNLWRTGHPNGHRQDTDEGEVLLMQQHRTLQTRLSQKPKDKGGGATMHQLLLGSCSNE